MRICIISKYPPIEGGVSARVYWLAKALGERGHEVHVVTNSQEVESEYKEIFELNDLEFIPRNIYLHSTNADTNPWHIPFSKAYTERIANLAIEVIEKYDLQIIDTYYILPYAVSGFIAKNITARPQILHHAGSDISKLFSSNAYQTLFKSVFQRVDKIITIPQYKKMFLSLGVKESVLDLNDQISINTDAFNPGVTPFQLSDYINGTRFECPIITYIGKINYYWQTKGLYELIEAVKNIKADFRLLFVSNGKGLVEFKNLIKEKNLENKTIFIDFVPPWKIPSIIKLSTCVIVPDKEFLIPNNVPILPREVMAVGKCLMISSELFSKKYYGNLIDEENVLVVDPKNIEQYSKVMKEIIRDPEIALRIGEKAYQHSIQFENFNEYIDFTIGFYRTLLNN
jgi:glycosyltransferase involved in cell wall biosynthesis